MAQPPPPRLKVFRTQIGLGDYVVAATSQKAALKAWDVSRNLFASGEAEVTDDPKAVAAAMTAPGKAVAVPLPKRAKAGKAAVSPTKKAPAKNAPAKKPIRKTRAQTSAKTSNGRAKPTPRPKRT